MHGHRRGRLRWAVSPVDEIRSGEAGSEEGSRARDAVPRAVGHDEAPMNRRQLDNLLPCMKEVNGHRIFLGKGIGKLRGFRGMRIDEEVTLHDMFWT
jgi:hypothetical protein